MPSDTLPDLAKFIQNRQVACDTIAVVVHAGSGDGSQSLILSSLFPKATVFALECDRNRLETCKNILKGQERITLIDKAIHNFTDHCDFFSPGSLFPPAEDDPGIEQDRYVVECTRLDDLCRTLGITRIDVLRLSVRGAELIALQSAGGLLDDIRFIHLEITFAPARAEQTSFDEADRFLRSKGFRLCTRIDRTTLRQNLIYEKIGTPGRHRPVTKSVAFNPGKSVIISQPWGGLGDNLQFSTLPERFAELDIPVFISEQNVIRNPEIYDLVWGCNPYVSGISSEPPNAGRPRIDQLVGLPPFAGFIERMEAAHGLEPRNRLPKIYYHPKTLPEIAGTILIDIGSTTIVPPQDHLQNYISFVIARFQYNGDDLNQVVFSNAVAGSHLSIGGLKTIIVNNIFHYCDLINSCKAFITVHSGAMSLAAAIRGERLTPFIHSFATTKQFNWKDYIYHNVDYFVL